MTEWAGFFIAFAIMAIAFKGDPDIADAIVYTLTDVKVWELPAND